MNQAEEIIIDRTPRRRLRVLAILLCLLPVLYVGSYFALAFATGAGWMEVETRQRIVWTVHRPLSQWATSDTLPGKTWVNDANGWWFTLGGNWLHE